MAGSQVAKLVEAILANVEASGRRELAADVVLTLIAYPAPIARKIFDMPWNWGVIAKTTELSDEVFSQVSEYFRVSFGVSLAAADLPARRKLNYLAGMIHFAKMRSTLLAEYGV